MNTVAEINDDTVRVKECPFCGKKPRYERNLDHNDNHYDSIWCGYCDIGFVEGDPIGGMTLVEWWNRRA